MPLRQLLVRLGVEVATKKAEIDIYNEMRDLVFLVIDSGRSCIGGLGLVCVLCRLLFLHFIHDMAQVNGDIEGYQIHAKNIPYTVGISSQSCKSFHCRQVA